MGFFNFIHNGMEFFFFGHVYRIIQVFTENRSVGRDFNYVHSVDITELFFFGKCSTGHAGFLFIFIEEVLECDCCKCLALTFYLYMLFCLDCLMQAIRVASSRHDTSGKLVYDQYFIIFYYIILITVHQTVCTQCQVDIVLDLQVLRIGKVIDLEELFYFLNTVLCQCYDFIFFIYDIVTGLCDLLAHNGRHFSHFTAGFTTLQLFCQNVTDFVQFCGLAALTGNDQRCTCLVDQD